MNKHILMKLPIYLLAFSAIYETVKRFRAQSEWNAVKKWNLAGCLFFTLGLLLAAYEDFLMD
jgi:hypothetical protein